MYSKAQLLKRSFNNLNLNLKNFSYEKIIFYRSSICWI